MVMKKQQARPVGVPIVDSATAIREIQGQIDLALQALAAGRIAEQWPAPWLLRTKNVLDRAFGANHDNVEAVMNAGHPGILFGDMTEADFEELRRTSLQKQVDLLVALVSVLQLQMPESPGPVAAKRQTGTSVFLVHGRDHRRHEVETVLRKLGLDVVILADQPSAGMTIIEKLEANSNCPFAVVLLTGDDVGGLNAPPNPELRRRARQNVILELGYFIGRLGRKNVCTLYEAGVELPSDYVGVGFVLLDDHDGWKGKLAKELKAASYTIDMNALM
jgi:predicted nucleotide-binding protein